MKHTEKTPLETLRHHVSGAVERGEAQAIAGQPERYQLRRFGTRGKWGVLEVPACRWAFSGSKEAAAAYFASLS